MQTIKNINNKTSNLKIFNFCIIFVLSLRRKIVKLISEIAVRENGLKLNILLDILVGVRLEEGLVDSCKPSPTPIIGDIKNRNKKIDLSGKLEKAFRRKLLGKLFAIVENKNWVTRKLILKILLVYGWDSFEKSVNR